MQTRRAQCLIRRWNAAAWLLLTSPMLIAQGTTPSTLAPASTPAHQIFDLSIFVIAITVGIFVVVGGLLAVALYRFRARKTDPVAEPARNLKRTADHGAGSAAIQASAQAVVRRVDAREKTAEGCCSHSCSYAHHSLARAWLPQWARCLRHKTRM